MLLWIKHATGKSNLPVAYIPVVSDVYVCNTCFSVVAVSGVFCGISTEADFIVKLHPHQSPLHIKNAWGPSDGKPITDE